VRQLSERSSLFSEASICRRSESCYFLLGVFGGLGLFGRNGANGRERGFIDGAGIIQCRSDDTLSRTHPCRVVASRLLERRAGSFCRRLVRSTYRVHVHDSEVELSFPVADYFAVKYVGKQRLLNTASTRSIRRFDEVNKEIFLSKYVDSVPGERYRLA
jgi:hypothetical protein